MMVTRAGASRRSLFPSSSQRNEWGSFSDAPQPQQMPCLVRLSCVFVGCGSTTGSDIRMAGTESSTVALGACPTAAAHAWAQKRTAARSLVLPLHVGLGDVDYRRLIGGTHVLKIAS